MIITIDGPAVSGKGTLARWLADKNSIYYLETGLLYRALGYAVSQEQSREMVLERGIDQSHLAEYTRQIVYEYENGHGKIMFNGVDITGSLRTKEIDWYASQVSPLPAMREAVRQIQQNVGVSHSLIAEGRDCGTIVFPHADYKFFLLARLDVRANRLVADRTRNNKNYQIADASRDILLRDIRDIGRIHGPLAPASDAIIIDNSLLTFEQTCALVQSYIDTSS